MDSPVNGYHPNRAARSRRRDKQITSSYEANNDLTAIFQIENQSYDVLLTDVCISWTNVAGTGKIPKLKKKQSIFKKLVNAARNNTEFKRQPLQNIAIDALLGAAIRKVKHAGQTAEGVCQGIVLYLYEYHGQNKWRIRLVELNHPSEELCSAFVRKIQSLLRAKRERPKRCKIFLQPFAGKQNGRSVYREKILPLLEAACLDIDLTEIQNKEDVKTEFLHLNLNEFDSIIVIGGDGTVSKVATGLVIKTQTDAGRELIIDRTPIKCNIPLGIIPIGTINQTAHTISGIEDIISNTIHIILGHKRSVDIMSVWINDKLLNFNFTANFGFFGMASRYFSRFTVLGDKKIELSIGKALSQKKFRSYECDIDYKPVIDTNRIDVCREDCDICLNVCSTTPRTARYSDAIERFEDSDGSIKSVSSTLDLVETHDEWKHLKDSYLSVSLLAMPSLSRLAPYGINQNGHLSDGIMDLILVKTVERREFVRFLKRLGSDKNCLTLPFVQHIKCSAVRFNLRRKDTWNFRDYNYHDVADNMIQQRRRAQRKNSMTKSITVIDQIGGDSQPDTDSDDMDDSLSRPASRCSVQYERNFNSPMVDKRNKKQSIVSMINHPPRRPSECGWSITPDENDNNNEVENNDDVDDSEGPRQRRRRRRRHFDQNNSNTNKSWNGSLVNISDRRQTISLHNSNLSFEEQEQRRLARKDRKKNERKRNKAEKKNTGFWALDMTLCNDTELEFRIHNGLLNVFTSGICADYEPDKASLGCLALF